MDDRITGESTLRRQAIGILLLLALDFFELASSCLSGSICGLECSFTLSQSLHELRIGRSVRLIECSLVAVERVRLVDELLIAAGFHRLESTREVVFGRAKTATSCSDCIQDRKSTRLNSSH